MWWGLFISLGVKDREVKRQSWSPNVWLQVQDSRPSSWNSSASRLTSPTSSSILTSPSNPTSPTSPTNPSGPSSSAAGILPQGIMIHHPRKYLQKKEIPLLPSPKGGVEPIKLSPAVHRVTFRILVEKYPKFCFLMLHHMVLGHTH